MKKLHLGVAMLLIGVFSTSQVFGQKSLAAESHIKNLAAGIGLEADGLHVLANPAGFSIFRAAGAATCDVQTISNPVAVGKPVIGTASWSGLATAPRLFVNGQYLDLWSGNGTTTWSFVPSAIGISLGVAFVAADHCQGIVGSFPVTGALDVSLTANGQKSITVPYGGEVILEWKIIKEPKLLSNHFREAVALKSTFGAESEGLKGKKTLRVFADGLHTVTAALYGQFGFDSVEIKVSRPAKAGWRK